MLDYTQRQEASGLVAIYLHGVQAIVDHSHLKGAEYLFIGEFIENSYLFLFISIIHRTSYIGEQVWHWSGPDIRAE